MTLGIKQETEFNNQVHTGTGDNIGRDKIQNIYKTITPLALHKPIEMILASLSQKQPEKAEDEIEILKAAQTLDANTLAILDIVSIHLDLMVKSNWPDAFQTLTSFLRDDSDEMLTDLCHAALIRLNVKNGSLKDGLERYSLICSPGTYTKEAFYELLANTDILTTEYEQNRLNLNQIELCSLVRGALRQNEPKLALTISERLNKFAPSFNSRVLLSSSKAMLIGKEIDNLHYWSISATLKNEIIDHADKIISLFEECKGCDDRVINLAVPLLTYVMYEYKPLADVCWRYISEITRLFPYETANFEYFFIKKIQKGLNETFYKIVKASQDERYKEKILTEILSTTEISCEDSTILSQIGTPKAIQSWLEQGGRVYGDEQFQVDFSELELAALAIDSISNKSIEGAISIEDVKSKAIRFISEYKSNIKNINPPRLLDLAGRFADFKFFSLVSEFLKPLISSKDIWPSPIVRCYLHVLLFGQQMESLSKILKESDSANWDDFIWQIKAQLSSELNDYNSAINEIMRALDINPLLYDGWFFLVYLNKKNGASIEKLADTLGLIPDKVYAKNNRNTLSVLSDLIKVGKSSKVEQIILTWFIDDPDSSCLAITDFFNNSVIVKKSDITFSHTVDKCLGGVKYNIDGQSFTKLIVTDDVPSHNTLLKKSSQLAEVLQELQIGDTKRVGMQDIQLVERLPPCIAAYHISLNLRHARNDGSDCFYSLSLPKEPDKMIEYLKDKFSPLNNGKDEIISNNKIPLYMKGHHLYQSEPVTAALCIIPGKKKSEQILPNIGENEAIEVILDVYSIIYISLTGLVNGIPNCPTKIIITTETKYCLEAWLEKINRDDYLTVNVLPDKSLVRTTAEDIRIQTKSIQDAIKIILDNSEVQSPNLADIPQELIRMNDFIDISVFSSMKLSSANNLSWLCIDGVFFELFMALKLKPVNPVLFLASLGHNVSIEKKKDGLELYSQGMIPYPITYREIFHLSESNDEHANGILSKILRKDLKPFDNTIFLFSFIITIIRNVILKAFFDGELSEILSDKDSIKNSDIVRVFNACLDLVLRFKNGIKTEMNFAILRNDLIYNFGGNPDIMRLISLMFNNYISEYSIDVTMVNQCTKV